jgi:hypothetical protein
MDDGLPASGAMSARTYSGCATGVSAADLTALYRLDSGTVACALFIRI